MFGGLLDAIQDEAAGECRPLRDPTRQPPPGEIRAGGFHGPASCPRQKEKRDRRSTDRRPHEPAKLVVELVAVDQDEGRSQLCQRFVEGGPRPGEREGGAP